MNFFFPKVHTLLVASKYMIWYGTEEKQGIICFHSRVVRTPWSNINYSWNDHVCFYFLFSLVEFPFPHFPAREIIVSENWKVDAGMKKKNINKVKRRKESLSCLRRGSSVLDTRHKQTNKTKQTARIRIIIRPHRYHIHNITPQKEPLKTNKRQTGHGFVMFLPKKKEKQSLLRTLSSFTQPFHPPVTNTQHRGTAVVFLPLGAVWFRVAQDHGEEPEERCCPRSEDESDG